MGLGAAAGKKVSVPDPQAGSYASSAHAHAHAMTFVPAGMHASWHTMTLLRCLRQRRWHATNGVAVQLEAWRATTCRIMPWTRAMCLVHAGSHLKVVLSSLMREVWNSVEARNSAMCSGGQVGRVGRVVTRRVGGGRKRQLRGDRSTGNPSVAVPYPWPGPQPLPMQPPLLPASLG